MVHQYAYSHSISICIWGGGGGIIYVSHIQEVKQIFVSSILLVIETNWPPIIFPCTVSGIYIFREPRIGIWPENKAMQGIIFQ